MIIQITNDIYALSYIVDDLQMRLTFTCVRVLVFDIPDYIGNVDIALWC